ncbi:Mu transposase C-terminal domain-containing protein [Dictyobacter formicarum]|uniref:DDE-type integrase/transposase/recombinase n=1 Tax=Dictyobacter formicarum TaxID=2778368 RepID=A0ABQ3VR55_9CHLR|nr:Mu transposase C-terminal domain-containing protein [Dictyobacter formicarum]GHO88189.1 DDE-type integrase/transposase/recombinase [Dictyobacter formicarum]
MGQQHTSLTMLTEAKLAEALRRFHLIRPFLEDGVPLTRIAGEHQIPVRTLRRWVQRYRIDGLAGLSRPMRKDKDQRRAVTAQVQQFIEGLALEKPRRTIATIHREVAKLTKAREWKTPSYSTVERIVQQLDPTLMTLAHEGSKVYREKFDVIYRNTASAPNEVWQADHSLLPILVRNEQGKPARPWLTIILDDYSRGVPGYYLGFASPTALQTALTLHQAIWHKADARWHLCGIPTRFYTDNGSDFTSHHLEQVAADLKIELVFSWPGHPRGRGKIERFFQTVEQMLLPHLPGFEGANGKTPGTLLSLSAFDTCFRTWLLEDYHQRVQEEIRSAPQARWEESGFLPQMPESLEQLDLLLLSVVKGRRVQQDGIHFQGQRYFETTLAAYVGEDVTIRYDPRDLAVIRVFYQGRFLCRAICAEFAGQYISLKEVIQTRTQQRKRVRQGIKDRLSVVEQIQTGTSSESSQSEHSPSPVEATPPPITPRLKRYFNE